MTAVKVRLAFPECLPQKFEPACLIPILRSARMQNCALQIRETFMTRRFSDTDARALILPASFANHVQIDRYGTTLVRLTFAEAPTPAAPAYRAAVLMHVDDARMLVEGLSKILAISPVMPTAQDTHPN